MNIYLLLWVIVCLLLIIFDIAKKEVYDIFIIFLLIFLSGFRYRVGVDYDSYLETFSKIIYDKINLFEPVNSIIARATFFLTGNIHLIFFVYSSITIILIYGYISKYSEFKGLSILIFLSMGIFYLSTYNGIRQWLAIAFVTKSIEKSNELKKKGSLIYAVLAFLTHYSAIIVVLIPFIKKRFKLYELIIISILLLIFGKVVFIILEYTPYSIYVKSLIFGKKFSIVSIVVLIVVNSIPIVITKYFKNSTPISTTEVMIINMGLFSTATLLLGFYLKIDSLSIMRMNSYWQIQLVLVIPLIINIIREKHIRLIVYQIVFSTMAIMYLNTIMKNGELYMLVPYSTILF